MSAAIAVEAQTKSFGRGRKALDAVALTLDRGEMVALIGASGSGKSTLLRLVSGMAPADRGSGPISVLGRPVQADGRIDPGIRRLRADIGVIFQQFNLVGRLSLLTNVLTGLLGRIPAWRGSIGAFTAAEKRRGMEILDRVGLADYAGQRASTLSGGQQQRAAIARAMIQGAKVVLADEPIASLDPQAARRVMAMLETLNREDGVTVLVTLHQVAYAQACCPRAVALRDGRTVYDGDTAALTPALLRELYGAESEEVFLSASSHADAPARPLAEPPFRAAATLA